MSRPRATTQATPPRASSQTTRRPSRQDRPEPTAAPDAWADDNLRRLVALKQLHLTLSPEKLNRLLSRHVGPEDGYPSESLLHHLVTLPLEPSVVTTSVKNLDLDIPIEKLIPLFDGESDPFPVQRWDDLARLPALEELTTGHPIPTPERLAAHPRLRRLRVPSSDERGRSQAKKIDALASAGFLIVATTGTNGWVELIRQVVPIPRAVLTQLDKQLPHRVSPRKGQPGWQLDLVEMTTASGDLVASLRLWLHGGEGHEPVRSESELLLLTARDLARPNAHHLVASGIELLRSFVSEHHALPPRGSQAWRDIWKPAKYRALSSGGSQA